MAFRTSENRNISDDEIADIYSDEDAMLLAAENEQCEVINNYMAQLQFGDQKV